eukprot:3604581-Karenia_brevis.AAC.1
MDYNILPERTHHLVLRLSEGIQIFIKSSLRPAHHELQISEEEHSSFGAVFVLDGMQICNKAL